MANQLSARPEVFDLATLAFPMSLAEKYRPKAIRHFLGLERERKILQAFAKAPFASTWLFTGAPGTGKTSIALALAEEITAQIYHIPSQKCNVENVQETCRLCWYIPMYGKFNLVLVDEADQMSNAAQLALLSKLDSTDPPPSTIFIFTCNSTARLEPRFLSRCRVLTFAEPDAQTLARFLSEVWTGETGKNGHQPGFFLEIAERAESNFRNALMILEVELLAQ